MTAGGGRPVRAGRTGRTVRLLAALALVAAVALAGCSDDDGDGAAARSTTSTTEAAASSTTATTQPTLHILVTNDDGYTAEGIDVLVEGLAALDHTEVTVVAPLDQRSGTGGKRTDGKVAVTDVELASGHPAKAVAGFPADTVRVAVDELGLKPDLVIAGINQGQNLGPIVDISGTIGAARAAVARGIPALAVSQGSGADDYQYASAVPIVLDWVRDHRDELLGDRAQPVVTNLNVPSCKAGDIRGLAEVAADLDGDPARSIGPQDCTSKDPLDPAAGDVEAFVDGYATLDEVPAEPKVPAEVVPAQPGG